MKCDRCGPLEYVLMDGYGVGDRLLERVMFELRHSPDGWVAATRAEDREYMEKLNERKWLKEVVEFAKQADVATCPKCGNDVDVEQPLGFPGGA